MDMSEACLNILSVVSVQNAIKTIQGVFLRLLSFSQPCSASLQLLFLGGCQRVDRMTVWRYAVLSLHSNTQRPSRVGPQAR